MSKYICSNCGNVQYSYGKTEGNSGFAQTFWVLCLIITIFISLFCPVAWVVVLFEILFIILTTPKNNKINICNKCNATNCVIPIDTPRGEEIYNQFYKKKDEIINNSLDNGTQEETIKSGEKTEEVKSWDDKIIEAWKENEEQYIKLIRAIVIILLIIGLGKMLKTDTPEQPQEKTTIKQELPRIEAKEEPQLSKTECYQIEQDLWSINRARFADNSKYINENYDKYKVSCSSYSAQIGVWKPDKNFFLHKNYEELAYDYYRKKDYSNAAIYYDKSIQEYNKSNTKRISAETSYRYGGLSYYRIDNFTKAEPYLLNAPKEVLEVNEALADIYLYKGDSKNAARYYSQSIYLINQKISYLNEQQDYERLAELEFQKQHYAQILYNLENNY